MINNTIFKKVCIANQLKHFEIKEIFALAGFDFSSSRVKAFMAGCKNKNYEKLSDEHLEGFLNGFILYSRGPVDAPHLLPRTIERCIIGLIEADNSAAIEAIRSLIEHVEGEDKETDDPR
ncbi:MAG: DUF1456 family protein [Mariprofundales bacterium]|nr:DUF1456 family protein [Mariprofundales bacterium]